ncbi:glycosyl hydrolase 115 family protein [Pontibacter sp. SGAir0037]|uniref:glycosyl hydrolase 115 family protein n=1 Tax=Pontibacter sp. SGAir0037 TaxID=2571030 RepID=UPI0010CD2640|nr:glycosyl hydrolase 115 family protein [Pontibacter sp. SGAir0037]QCR24645.1 hypothetical protein C1N53_21330 [Pontibacter sp. SGAir0037]
MRINFFFLLLFSVLLSSCLVKTQSSRNVVLNGNTVIYTSAKPGEPLYVAVSALQRDMEKVLGQKSGIKPLTEIREPGIVIVNAAEIKLVKPATGWEAHRVYTSTVNQQRHVILQGADVRGTIFAIYTFSEKVLGVPPLWYYSGWTPQKQNQINVSASLDLNFPSPDVKYRAWFPNDTDLFAPWRKSSESNYKLWLETAMRLKLNTIEWFDDERSYADKYSVSPTTKLIQDYGFINTTHHHSPLNASFEGWEDYWNKTRNTTPPELSLANEKYLEEFWRYNIESIVRNDINMLWVLGLRGRGDRPFWFTFNDAPESMKERGEVISRMLAKQRQIVMDVTGNPNPQFRTIFYDELSDLLAQGYIQPPADSTFIWTYVAARRDHYPNEDMQQLDNSKNLRLGYYFNYQFTSTGSHLAAGEGPWKMEANYRYVASKTNQPIAFSVVNAGNIREFVMELSANAAMMWDFESYETDSFLKDFCAQYYGSHHATEAANLYTDYYNAYWQQRKPDLKDFDRQFVFQDLRYKRAIQEIGKAFDEGYNPNPFTDIPAEQLKGRTYRIIPEDINATNQIEAVINGTTQSAADFLSVAKKADDLYARLDESQKTFFNDNLRAPAWYMYYLNESLLSLSKAYMSDDTTLRQQLLNQSYAALKNAEKTLRTTEQGNFQNWYAGDRIFGFKSVYRVFENLVARK